MLKNLLPQTQIKKIIESWDLVFELGARASLNGQKVPQRERRPKKMAGITKNSTKSKQHERKKGQLWAVKNVAPLNGCSHASLLSSSPKDALTLCCCGYRFRIIHLDLSPPTSLSLSLSIFKTWTHASFLSTKSMRIITGPQIWRECRISRYIFEIISLFFYRVPTPVCLLQPHHSRPANGVIYVILWRVCVACDISQ